MIDIIEQIKDAVVSGKHKEIEGPVRAAVDEKVDLNAIISDGLIEAMDIVGKKFGVAHQRQSHSWGSSA